VWKPGRCYWIGCRNGSCAREVERPAGVPIAWLSTPRTAATLRVGTDGAGQSLSEIDYEKDRPRSAPARHSPPYFRPLRCWPSPLFCVNPNIPAHDALVHVAQYLRGAYESGYKALEPLDETGKSLFWSNLDALENG